MLNNNKNNDNNNINKRRIETMVIIGSNHSNEK